MGHVALLWENKSLTPTVLWRKKKGGKLLCAGSMNMLCVGERIQWMRVLKEAGRGVSAAQ